MEHLIQQFKVSRTRQEQGFGFHTLVRPIFKELKDPVILPLMERYEQSICKFDDYMKLDRGSVHTNKLTEADRQVGVSFFGLKQHAERMTSHTIESKAAAAEAIVRILKKYANATTLPYVQQIGSLSNMVQELETGESKANLQEIGATVWFEDLVMYHNQVVSIFSERNSEQSAIPTGAAKAAFNETNENYRNLVQAVNTMIHINGPEQYADVVARINQLISREKAVLAARKNRNSENGE